MNIGHSIVLALVSHMGPWAQDDDMVSDEDDADGEYGRAMKNLFRHLVPDVKLWK